MTSNEHTTNTYDPLDSDTIPDSFQSKHFEHNAASKSQIYASSQTITGTHGLDGTQLISCTENQSPKDHSHHKQHFQSNKGHHITVPILTAIEKVKNVFK
jgi:hypothetical protein